MPRCLPTPPRSATSVIDLLRVRGRERALEERVERDDALGPSPAVSPDHPVETAQRVIHALDRLVAELAPKERACVILKDVLGHSLEEIAGTVDSTVGGVKSALHRGRTKLQELAERPLPPGEEPGRSDEEEALVAAYVERFNARDWEGLEALLAADARLEVVDTFLAESCDGITGQYFGRYRTMDPPMAFSLGRVDGERVIVSWRLRDGSWRAEGAVRLGGTQGRVRWMRDYLHVPYLLEEASVEAPTPGRVG